MFSSTPRPEHTPKVFSPFLAPSSYFAFFNFRSSTHNFSDCLETNQARRPAHRNRGAGAFPTTKLSSSSLARLSYACAIRKISQTRIGTTSTQHCWVNVIRSNRALRSESLSLKQGIVRAGTRSGGRSSRAPSEPEGDSLRGRK